MFADSSMLGGKSSRLGSVLRAQLGTTKNPACNASAWSYVDHVLVPAITTGSATQHWMYIRIASPFFTCAVGHISFRKFELVVLQ
jgi:hypothetical protein